MTVTNPKTYFYFFSLFTVLAPNRYTCFLFNDQKSKTQKKA